MNSAQLVNDIMERKNTSGKNAFWMGNPHEDTFKNYMKATGTHDLEELQRFLNDDCRHMFVDGCYKHPEGKPVFDPKGGVEGGAFGENGVFAECEDVAEIEAYEWPDVKYLDFSDMIAIMDMRKEYGMFTGLWSPFFHHACDYFGMENYFAKMYTDPEVALRVTEKIADFYACANDIFFEKYGERKGILFIGNDLGTQRDLLISPECFDKFLKPSFKKIIDSAKKHGQKVMMHSCGAIGKIIPTLIDLGIDALNPLQAKAAGMDAETLAREYKNDIAFCGGVDTQDLLVNATPEQVREEVLRLRDVLGENFIVSPSHECLLPNISFENTLAMARAAKE